MVTGSLTWDTFDPNNHNFIAAIVSTPQYIEGSLNDWSPGKQGYHKQTTV